MRISDNQTWSLDPLGASVPDTQEISYCMKRSEALPSGTFLTSVTVQEFLLMQTRSVTRNAYYIPDAHQPRSTFDLRRLADRAKSTAIPAGKVTTDRLVIDFNNFYPSVVEYSHYMLATAINLEHWDLIKAASTALRSEKRAVVRDRIRFLQESQAQCLPLLKESAEASLSLFWDFTAHHNLKSNFRNSLNDILTLAITLRYSACLVTTDRVLGRFQREVRESNAVMGAQGKSFPSDLSTSRPSARDSKGYVNRGWNVRQLR